MLIQMHVHKSFQIQYKLCGSHITQAAMETRKPAGPWKGKSSLAVVKCWIFRGNENCGAIDLRMIFLYRPWKGGRSRRQIKPWNIDKERSALGRRRCKVTGHSSDGSDAVLRRPAMCKSRAGRKANEATRAVSVPSNFALSLSPSLSAWELASKPVSRWSAATASGGPPRHAVTYWQKARPVFAAKCSIPPTMSTKI